MVAAELERLPQVYRDRAVVTPSTLWGGKPDNMAGSLPVFSPGPDKVIPAGYPIELTQPVVPEEYPPILKAPPAGLPPGAKPGVFQQGVVTYAYLPQGRHGFGQIIAGKQLTFAFPFPTVESPLLFQPAFDGQELSGPRSPDLPAHLYDISLGFSYLRPISASFKLNLGVTPGWHSDFDHNDSNAFRMPARVVGIYDYSPDLQAVLGVAYLDRDDIDWLPVGGFNYTPNPDTKLELVFPRPRIARRFLVEQDAEQWWYILGEFGGGPYAIMRDNGARDVATLSDLRLIFGVERKAVDGISLRFEAGYVFARQIDYRSSTPDFNPGDTAIIRAGASF